MCVERNKENKEEVTTELLRGWKDIIEGTRGARGVHAYSTALHCTTWSNHRKIFYHAHNANKVEQRKNNSGKACREYCQHWPVREARHMRPRLKVFGQFSSGLNCASAQPTKKKTKIINTASKCQTTILALNSVRYTSMQNELQTQKMTAKCVCTSNYCHDFILWPTGA